MTPVRIGGGLIILSGAALVLNILAPLASGPGLIVPAALLCMGAAMVSVAGPRPLDAVLTRVGLGIAAVGALSVVVLGVISYRYHGNLPDQDLATLAPYLISLGAIPIGWLVIGLSLARSSGSVRAVGAMLLLGVLLLIIGEALTDALAYPTTTQLIGLGVAVLGLAGVGALALSVGRFQQRVSV